MLNIGDVAPGITLPDQNGNTRTLDEWRGRKVVLYFYPKDNTAGCTKQAVGFTELREQFLAAGADIIGISKDSVKSHKNFETKQNLGITLLSDPELVAIQAYGAWAEKKNYGKTYMGVVRTTYLIDEQGVIAWASNKVKAADNPAQMLELVK